MLTDITLDTATIILPVNDIQYRAFERLNRDLGAYVLAEVDFETKSFTKFDIDYSLIEYNDIEDATQEAQLVYDYMLKFFGIKDTVDANQWAIEQEAA
jgi:hypothetical protein